MPFASYDYQFTLNRQFRTWPVKMGWEGDTLLLTCKEAVYLIPRHEVENSDSFCWLIPADGALYNKVKGTFGFISQRAMRDLQQKGWFVYDTITWRKTGENAKTFHVVADIDRTEMWISKTEKLPIVLQMSRNPLGIDWRVE